MAINDAALNNIPAMASINSIEYKADSLSFEVNIKLATLSKIKNAPTLPMSKKTSSEPSASSEKVKFIDDIEGALA